MVPTRLAKLSPPRTSQWVTRPRLHHRLADLSQHGAVWVVAGPGAGKSTLAACWAAERGPRTLWYRVDAGDRDPAGAFAYFAQLAQQGRRRAPALPVYRPQELDQLDTFARHFFRAFFGAVPAASTLIVDDAHAAAGSDFDTLLAAAVAEAPADDTLVVLSRQEPGGRLLDHVARGTLQVLADDSLAFTGDEAAALLAGRVDRDTAARLQAQADGWAAGLLLLAQAPSPDVGAAPGRERIHAFFAERVLATLGEADAGVLSAAALLPDVDDAALRAMGFGDEAAELLERLRRQHAFVTRLDRQPPSWRLHDLLRDAVAQRFDSVRDAGWRARVRKAAALVAQQRGLACDAVALLLKAGDAGAALRVAEQSARGLVKALRLHELDGLADLLGDAAAGSVPLLTAHAEAAWQRNDARTAVDRFERAYTRLSEPAPSASGLWIAASAITAILEGWQDFSDTDRWMTRLREQAGARAQITDPDDGMRVDTAILQSTNMVWGEGLGGPEPIVARMLDALRHRASSLSPSEAVAASSVLMEAAGYRLSNGTLFREIAAATVPWLQRPELAPLAKAGWLITYAPLGRRWPTPGLKLPANDPVACLELAVDIARAHGGRSVAFSGALFLAHMAVAMNDRATAAKRLAALREFVDPAHPRQVINVLEVESNVLALHGDVAQAQSVIGRARELAERHAFPSSQMWNIEVYEQRLAIAAGQYGPAQDTLRRNAGRYPAGNRRDFALILADVAAAGEALEAHGSVPPQLVRAIMERARAYDWPGFSAQLAPLAARVCAEALRLGIEPDFARRTVQNRQLPPPSPFEPHWPWPVRVRALGTLAIEIDGEPLDFGPRAQRKPLDLMRVLVAHGPAPVDAAVVLDALWPDADGASARASFDMAVMRLRKLLGRADVLKLDGSHVGLDLGQTWVDAFAFAKGATDDYPGPLFGNDAVQPWWAAARERLHQRFLRRTAERGRALESQGRHDDALAVYEAGLAQDALAEELYQGAIRCHLAAGRPADAMRAFRRCRDQLSIVLGVKPSAATTALAANAQLQSPAAVDLRHPLDPR
jgi:LuxR family maltose regulon positive regulatory protein